MKAFFGNIWKYLAVFFAGVIAALVYAMDHYKPAPGPVETTINTTSYVANQEQNIGKLKQRGDGNVQDVTQPVVELTRKELRQERRAKRKAERQSRASVRYEGMGIEEERMGIGEEGVGIEEVGKHIGLPVQPLQDDVAKMVLIVGLMLSFRGWY
ncbi:MAG TPA: hypothetical protein DCL77_14520 [Prolixibacteraceae bacterium]|jgi:hypothetical protein|nr:hypothetical protein [Prolixibacteraceae bacterium]